MYDMKMNVAKKNFFFFLSIIEMSNFYLYVQIKCTTNKLKEI